MITSARRRLIGVVFFSFVVVLVFVLLSRGRGGLLIDVEVFPRDARLYINGKESSAGTIRLAPGDYVFTAKKEGFSDAVEKTSISEKRTYIALLPAPVSDEAIRWANENNAERERLGGENALSRGEGYRSKNPIIEILPEYNIAGPFSIDYGASNDTSDNTYLLIGNSTPRGRVRALQWIRDHGYNPSELDIRFEDFVNPATEESQ
jgi:hypothetical protein